MKERYYHHAYENAKLVSFIQKVNKRLSPFQEARKLLAKLRRCEKLNEIHNKFEQTVDYAWYCDFFYSVNMQLQK